MAEPFFGEIMLFGGNFAIRGYAFCNGQMMAISQNDALYTLIGTTYGGNGVTTFALPDLRGRLPVGQGNGPGLSSRTIGQSGGTESVTLTTTNLPTHTHPLACNTGAGTATVPTGNFWAATSNASAAPYGSTPDTSMNPASLSAAGGNQPHDNMMPYLGMNFLIAIDGLFPLQN